jgi:hypothetical protein
MEDLSKYRGNSHAEKQQSTEKRKPVEPIISTPPIQRKRSVWGRVRAHLTGADAAEVGSYLFADVIIPSIKDLLFDIVTEGSSRSLYGDSRRSASRGRPVSSSYTPYNRPTPNRNRNREDDRPKQLTYRERATHDFSNLIFRNAGEAEAVADRLYEQVAQYGVASVNDFYSAMGMTGEFTDDKYGWTSLEGTRVRKIRDGYILDLPRTEQLD